MPLFDYLSDITAVLDAEVEDRWRAFSEQVEDAYATTRTARRAGGESGLLPRPSRLHITPAQADRALAGRVVEAEPDGASVDAPLRVEALIKVARAATARGDRVAIAAPDPAAVAAPPPPDLRVGLTGRIPASTVPEPNLRLGLYARMARVTHLAELTEFEDELTDRFGPPPPELAGLLMLVRLRCCCAQRSVARLDAGPQGAALTPCDAVEGGRLAKELRGLPKNGRVLLDILERSPLARTERLVAALNVE